MTKIWTEDVSWCPLYIYYLRLIDIGSSWFKKLIFPHIVMNFHFFLHFFILHQSFKLHLLSNHQTIVSTSTKVADQYLKHCFTIFVIKLLKLNCPRTFAPLQCDNVSNFSAGIKLNYQCHRALQQTLKSLLYLPGVTRCLQSGGHAIFSLGTLI